jgi:hypothetical protein
MAAGGPRAVAGAWVDDGPEEKLVFYCPECAVREFGDA